MRFESKHRYFKNIIKHSQNFKNITKLFSLKHQFLQSVERNTYRTSVIADNAEIYIPENFESISFVLTDYFSDKSENFKYIVSKVIFKGIIYKTGMSICVGKNCYDYFLICKIKYLLIDDCYSSIYFLGKMIKVIYNPDFAIYEQFELKSQEHTMEKISVFPYSSLLAPHPVLETHRFHSHLYLQICTS